MFAITRKQKEAKLAKAEREALEDFKMKAEREREEVARDAYNDARISGKVLSRNCRERGQEIGDFRTHYLYSNTHADSYIAGRYHQGFLDGIQLGLEGFEAQKVNLERFPL